MTRDEALALPNAELLLNGRCVGHIELDDRYGTVLVMDWHDPAGCEHRPEVTVVHSPEDTARLVGGDGL